MTPTGKILHWVPDTDMRCCHDGLAAEAKKHLRVKVEDLRPGEFVLFMNRSWTAFKVYAANNMILHYRSPTGARLNAKAVLSLPHFIRGQAINYPEALAHTIRKEYGGRYAQPSKPAQ